MTLPKLPDDHPDIRARGFDLRLYVAGLLDRVAKLGERGSALPIARTVFVERLRRGGDLHDRALAAVLARVDAETSNGAIFETVLDEIKRLAAMPAEQLPTFLAKVSAAIGAKDPANALGLTPARRAELMK